MTIQRYNLIFINLQGKLVLAILQTYPCDTNPIYLAPGSLILLYGRRSLAFGPRPSCSDIFMVFLSFKTGYLIYLFITWNNSIIGSALIIIYDEYYEPKSKIKAHELVTFTRARKTNKNNLTYLFHAKTWLDLFFNISH